jgi:hypothetical protein
MKEYLFFFRGGLDFSQAPPEQLQQVLTNWKNWIEDLTKKGIYGGGDRVTRNDAAFVQGKAKQVTPGPYAANNEMVGGYIKIKADNLREAIDNSKGCPIFNFDGNIEIREVANNA